jgi:LmbE family N-acetylglucosaminyl deacetylase
MRHLSAASRRLALVAALSLSSTWAMLAIPLPATAQSDPLAPPSTGGLEAVARGLVKLETHARLLVVGAHPDDEDTALLAWVARGAGGEAAYLSLSRGEGGQNLVGPDLGLGLGLVRTRELEAARRTDGARQYFTRAMDFGFTTSLQESLGRWPREEVLADALRVVRAFRPQVIVSIFPADGGGGHGQHQEAGLIAHQIAVLGGDPAAHPELAAEGLSPWRPEALYRSAWFDRAQATVKLSTSGLEPWSGRSIYQIAMASRGQHRSQDMGRLQDLGPHESYLTWVSGPTTAASGGSGASGGSAAGTPTAPTSTPFAGIDTRLRAIAAILPDGKTRHEVAARLEKVEVLARGARSKLRPDDGAAAVAPLREILARLGEARERARALPDKESAKAPGALQAVVDLIDEKIAVAEVALAAAANVAVDATVEGTGTVVAGSSADVRWVVWNAGKETVRFEGLEFETTAGIRFAGAAAPSEDLLPGALREGKAAIEFGADASTEPYFLRAPLRGALYDWSAAAPGDRGRPFGAPPLRARLRLRIGDTALTLVREVVGRRADQVAGEVRKPLHVVPTLEVTPETRLEIVRRGEASRPRTLRVGLASHGSTALTGRLVAEVPAGWPAPAAVDFTLPPGASETFELPWSVPPQESGRWPIHVRAELTDGRTFAAAAPQLNYPHIPPVERREPAVFEVESFELSWPQRAVGYVRGTSDRVPEALVAAGLGFELVDAAALEHATPAELERFDVLVIGARAYESQPGLAAARENLAEFTKRGGLVVVQYQQYPFLEQQQALVPFTIARPHDRVTDENAAVTPLVADSSVFAAPNRLTAADWAGWVQERGLYFAHDWDPAYVPLLEIGSGAGALRGGLLVAPYGQGRYVYTGLAFFRQLPAGVPGAYRLFANLLALGPAKSRPATRSGG